MKFLCFRKRRQQAYSVSSNMEIGKSLSQIRRKTCRQLIRSHKKLSIFLVITSVILLAAGIFLAIYFANPEDPVDPSDDSDSHGQDTLVTPLVSLFDDSYMHIIRTQKQNMVETFICQISTKIVQNNTESTSANNYTVMFIVNDVTLATANMTLVFYLGEEPLNLNFNETNTNQQESNESLEQENPDIPADQEQFLKGLSTNSTFPLKIIPFFMSPVGLIETSLRPTSMLYQDFNIGLEIIKVYSPILIKSIYQNLGEDRKRRLLEEGIIMDREINYANFTLDNNANLSLILTENSLVGLGEDDTNSSESSGNFTGLAQEMASSEIDANTGELLSGKSHSFIEIPVVTRESDTSNNTVQITYSIVMNKNTSKIEGDEFIKAINSIVGELQFETIPFPLNNIKTDNPNAINQTQSEAHRLLIREMEEISSKDRRFISVRKILWEKKFLSRSIHISLQLDCFTNNQCFVKIDLYFLTHILTLNLFKEYFDAEAYHIYKLYNFVKYTVLNNVQNSTQILSDTSQQLLENINLLKNQIQDSYLNLNGVLLYQKEQLKNIKEVVAQKANQLGVHKSTFQTIVNTTKDLAISNMTNFRQTLMNESLLREVTIKEYLQSLLNDFSNYSVDSEVVQRLQTVIQDFKTEFRKLPDPVEAKIQDTETKSLDFINTFKTQLQSIPNVSKYLEVAHNQSFVLESVSQILLNDTSNLRSNFSNEITFFSDDAVIRANIDFEIIFDRLNEFCTNVSNSFQAKETSNTTLLDPALLSTIKNRLAAANVPNISTPNLLTTFVIPDQSCLDINQTIDQAVQDYYIGVTETLKNSSTIFSNISSALKADLNSGLANINSTSDTAKGSFQTNSASIIGSSSTKVNLLNQVNQDSTALSFTGNAEILNSLVGTYINPNQKIDSTLSDYSSALVSFDSVIQQLDIYGKFVKPIEDAIQSLQALVQDTVTEYQDAKVHIDALIKDLHLNEIQVNPLDLSGFVNDLLNLFEITKIDLTTLIEEIIKNPSKDFVDKYLKPSGDVRSLLVAKLNSLLPTQQITLKHLSFASSRSASIPIGLKTYIGGAIDYGGSLNIYLGKTDNEVYIDVTFDGFYRVGVSVFVNVLIFESGCEVFGIVTGETYCMASFNFDKVLGDLECVLQVDFALKTGIYIRYPQIYFKKVCFKINLGFVKFKLCFWFPWFRLSPKVFLFEIPILEKQMNKRLDRQWPQLALP